VDRLRVDFQDEKHTAHDSRAAIRRRLDEQAQVRSTRKSAAS
jgi:hypothetical protein